MGLKEFWGTTQAHTQLLERAGGRSAGRLAALSDGVFAIAMTLLVLNLTVPAASAIHSEADLNRVLLALVPRLLVYGLSFLTLGTFWNGQQILLESLATSHRSLTWINLAFLFGISLVPFSTGLLAELPSYQGALLLYWGNILLPGIALHQGSGWARRLHLIKDDAIDVSHAMQRRIVILMLLYTLGASLCFFHPYWSIAFIIAVQLYFVGRGAAPGRE